MDDHNEPILPEPRSHAPYPSPSAAAVHERTGVTRQWGRMAAIFVIGLVLASLSLQFISLTGQSFALLFVAIVIGEAASPIVTFLAKVMPRGLAVAVIFLTFVGAIAGLGFYHAPQIAEQTTELIEQLPEVIDEATEAVDDAPMAGSGDDVWSGIQSNFGNFTTMLVSVPMTIFNSLAQVVIMAFMAAYWMISRRAVREFLESLVPGHAKQTMREILMELSETVGGYVRGTGIGALLVGTIV